MENKQHILTWLQKIQGIGPVSAQKLYKHFKKTKVINNETTEVELRDLLKSSKEINLPLEAEYDLKYNPLKRVEREKVKHFDDLLKSDDLFIGGSYCRGRSFSGDIDILYKGNLDSFKKLSQSKGIEMTEIISGGPFRNSTYFKLNDEYIHVDIFLTTEKAWIFTKLYVIGSGGFNLLMRSYAKKKNMVLNQESISKIKENGELKEIKCKTEKDIFKLVGMDYKKWQDYSARDLP